MWTELRKEIENLRNSFGLSDSEFQNLGLNEWKSIEQKIYESFCKLTHYKSRPVWLWEHFKLKTCSTSTIEKPYLFLDKLIDSKETIYFFVNETVNEYDKFWFYQGKINAIQKIIANASYIDECYLTSTKYEWLICINHHDTLFITGKNINDKLFVLENIAR